MSNDGPQKLWNLLCWNGVYSFTCKSNHLFFIISK